MMDDVGIAIVTAAIFSVLISLIEIKFYSKASFEQQLNTHVLNALGPDRLAELRASAQAQNVDMRLLLALSLAYNAPEAAAAIHA